MDLSSSSDNPGTLLGMTIRHTYVSALSPSISLQPKLPLSLLVLTRRSSCSGTGEEFVIAGAPLVPTRSSPSSLTLTPTSLSSPSLLYGCSRLDLPFPCVLEMPRMVTVVDIRP
jgi:hypothetical protein